jgi:alpha/beta superfamily hydrolase
VSSARLTSLMIEGPAGPLEALLQELEAHEPQFIAVVCHPHPLGGGTLHNKVVHRVAATLFGRGVAVLRFNFRGVGKSAGTHDRGAGELDDARAALEWMRNRHPRARAWLAGFSFGSWIAARLAAARPQVERVILVAPPLRTSSFETMHTAKNDKIVIQGTADDICPPELLERDFPLWAEPKRLMWVEGASHFFDRKLAELSEALTTALGAE